MSVSGRRCRSCRFFLEAGDPGSGLIPGGPVEVHGECRRYPPRQAWDGGVPVAGSMWPKVDYEDWCGEWQQAAHAVQSGPETQTLDEADAEVWQWMREHGA